MSKIKIDSQFDLSRVPVGEHYFIQNHCKECGWSGIKYFSYTAKQHEDCKNERIAHRTECV